MSSEVCLRTKSNQGALAEKGGGTGVGRDRWRLRCRDGEPRRKGSTGGRVRHRSLPQKKVLIVVNQGASWQLTSGLIERDTIVDGLQRWGGTT